MKFLQFSFLSLVLLFVSCAPQGELALPAQNVAERFEVEGGFYESWTWTTPASPTVLSLTKQGDHEMRWSVMQKSLGKARRVNERSLQIAPRYFTHGPAGVEEVRFSPSGRRILVHEKTADGGLFQTLLFSEDSYTGAWSSRVLSLGDGPETKLRTLDDNTEVPALLGDAVPPRILRLDEEVVIYEVDGKTRSFQF